MEKVLQSIAQACAKYRNEELDEGGFRKVIRKIPAILWQDKDLAMAMLRALVENEDLYEVSLRKHGVFAEFVCNFLPSTFWSQADYVVSAATMIADFMAEHYEGADCCDLNAAFSRVPPTMWEDDRFVTAATNAVVERAYSMCDLNCISQVIPESVWKTEEDLCELVLSVFREDERNMAYLSLFPEKVWESAKVIGLLFSCLSEAVENDRSWGTVYGNFRRRDEEYVTDFLACVPEKFTSDKTCVLGLLESDYFSGAFNVLYDWMDASLWADKDVVLRVLEVDCMAVIRVAEQLAGDAEVRAYIEENIDFDWDLQYIPQDKIPQWIKDWTQT